MSPRSTRQGDLHKTSRSRNFLGSCELCDSWVSTLKEGIRTKSNSPRGRLKLLLRIGGRFGFFWRGQTPQDGVEGGNPPPPLNKSATTDGRPRMVRHFLVQLLRLMLVPVGAMVAIISSLGVLINYQEWGDHSCRGPQPVDPICGSIFWLIVEFLILALIGAGLVVVGLGVRLPSKKKPRVA